MKTSTKGKIALAVNEGLVDTAYLDSVGVWTIGIGHTKSAGGIDPKAYIGKYLTISQIMDLFDKDLPKYEDIVNRNVKVALKQNEFDALVHFVYNIGEPNFKKSKLLANLNAGNKTAAWATGFHGWLKPPEIRGRRDKERDMAQKGVYGSSLAPLYTATTAGKLKAKGTVDLSKIIKSDNTTDSANPDATSVKPTTPVTPTAPTTTTPKETPKVKTGFWALIEALFALFTSKSK